MYIICVCVKLLYIYIYVSALIYIYILIELVETDRTQKKHCSKYINNRKKEILIFPLITFIMKEII